MVHLNMPVLTSLLIYLLVNIYAYFTAVRLVNSYLSHAGRVEVLYSGTWGTICSDYWDLPDAEVVCHQLGYDGALRAVRNAAFGQGTGQIWLDDVQCVGNERSISHCNHLGLGAHNCRHYKDAGVVCRPAGNLEIHAHNKQLKAKRLTFRVVLLIFSRFYKVLRITLFLVNQC